MNFIYEAIIKQFIKSQIKLYIFLFIILWLHEFFCYLKLFRRDKMNSIIQAQGLHHITLNGADKKTSIDFWQNILGMRFIFEQPNLDDLNTNHLYFDCGDGTTVTVFTNENLKPDKQKLKYECGGVHHVAFWVSQSTIRIAEKNLTDNGFANTGIKDRDLWIQFISGAPWFAYRTC